jgi:hypothetical protein
LATRSFKERYIFFLMVSSVACEQCEMPRSDTRGPVRKALHQPIGLTFDGPFGNKPSWVIDCEQQPIRSRENALCRIRINAMAGKVGSVLLVPDEPHRRFRE